MRGRVAASLLLCATLTLTGCSARPASPPAGSESAPDVPFTVSEVILPYRACGKPQRVGSAIYVEVSRGEDKGSSILRYDLETRAIDTVVAAPDPQLIGWFVVNDDWLVWSVDKLLTARPRSGGATQTLSTTRDLYAPALSGDLVAWDDLSAARTHQVVLHNLASGESTVVAPVQLADLYNNYPAWDGPRLVWTDVRGDSGVYRSLDTGTGRITDYLLDEGRFRIPGYPQPTTGKIFSVNFADATVWDWGIQQVGYYSVAERRFVPLVPDAFVANSLDVAGGLVAIVDSDQRLTVRRAAEPHGRAYRPVEGRVDFVQSSADGTLIAWREAEQGKDRCRLFLIEPQ